MDKAVKTFIIHVNKEKFGDREKNILKEILGVSLDYSSPRIHLILNRQLLNQIYEELDYCVSLELLDPEKKERMY